ncbi:hypothetical protein BDV10DRAFT_173167 [Aspergillus recurvatus]
MNSFTGYRSVGVVLMLAGAFLRQCWVEMLRDSYRLRESFAIVNLKVLCVVLYRGDKC